MDNVFLKIVRGESPSYSIYEDEHVLAFLDIEPYSEGHTLIVPKTYCADIENLEKNTAAAVLMAAKKIARALRTTYGYKGIILHQVNGAGAQDIRQFHMHVYGSLAKDIDYFYKTLPNNELKRATIFENTTLRIKECLKQVPEI